VFSIATYTPWAPLFAPILLPSRVLFSLRSLCPRSPSPSAPAPHL